MSGHPNTPKNKVAEVESRLRFSKKLQAVTNKIHSTTYVDEIMLDLSRDICELFNCDRLTLYAISKDKDFIFSKVKTGLNTNKDLVLPINAQSVAGYVATFKRSVRISDAYDQAELKAYSPELGFRREVDQVTGYHTRQILAAPVVNANTKELLGVIQLMNNLDDGPFTLIAEEGLKELCETLAIAFFQRMKTPAPVRSKYEPLIVDSIISAPELELAARWARRKNIDVEDALVDEFQVKLSAIGQALSKTFKAPYEPYRADRVTPVELLKNLTREQAEKNNWLPLHEDQVGLVILTTDLENENSVQVIKKMFPYAAFFYRITTKREFRQTIDQFFGVADDSISGAV